MSKASKKLSFDELEMIAKDKTRLALADYKIPENILSDLVLGVQFEESSRIFELYKPGEKSSDALVICRVKLDEATGEGDAKVFNLDRL
jgi:hypothetical protein